MKTTLKSLISIILVLSVMLSTAIVASAAYEIEEEYISDLRLVYADTYEEAVQSFADSKLEGYKVLNHNLNEYSGKKAVWLAYKVTTNINDAITDVAVMQMGGGYSAANYHAMIESSREEYLETGDVYMQAIDYFTEAYDSGDFLAESAYRQLNFYAGFDKYPDQGLGDLFIDGMLRVNDVADLFFESNSSATENIRTLLAMGVSYNEDGTHYLERVDKIVEDMKEGTGLKAFSDTDVDIFVYSNNDLKTLSQFIVPNILVFRSMFEELSAYEGELDYTDGEVTDLEIKYAEYKAVAEMMRSVDYIGGQSLYDFCLNYVLDTSDYSSIHPLAVALNEGQIAMTKLAHYYDVVRYSMSEYPEESINEDITRLEERYIDNPFEIYMGVDRSLFDDTFALTTNAYRANAYDESNALGECLFGGINIAGATTQLNMGRIGTRFSVWSIVKAGDNGSSNMADGLSQKAVEKLDELTLKALEDIENTVLEGSVTYGEYIDYAYARMEQELGEDLIGDVKDAWNSSPHIIDKAMALVNAIYSYKLPTADVFDVGYMQGVGTSLFFVAWEKLTADPTVSMIKTLGTGVFDIGMYGWGTISSIRSAIALYDKIHDHYHPKYDEIPMVMVDVVDSEGGNKYVRYDVVLDMRFKDGEYHAADLNAFEGERWNALYYTKSSDAGKPLLADFVLSNNNNRADAGYDPVHRFGEVICYDLNKYNFSSDSAMIFLSIRQSEKQKSIVTEAPQVVGSIFGTGFWLVAGCVGIVCGVGVTLTAQVIAKKAKKRRKQ